MNKLLYAIILNIIVGSKNDRGAQLINKPMEQHVLCSLFIRSEQIKTRLFVYKVGDSCGSLTLSMGFRMARESQATFSSCSSTYYGRVLSFIFNFSTCCRQSL